MLYALPGTRPSRSAKGHEAVQACLLQTACWKELKLPCSLELAEVNKSIPHPGVHTDGLGGAASAHPEGDILEREVCADWDLQTRRHDINASRVFPTISTRSELSMPDQWAERVMYGDDATARGPSVQPAGDLPAVPAT